MAEAFDPRLTPARPDLAARSLEGRVTATRFVDGWTRQVIGDTVPLRRAPQADAPLDTEALFAERLTVFEEAGGWAWVQAQRDGYVGYTPLEGLGTPVLEPTATVKVLRALIFSRPDLKSRPLGALSLSAGVTVTGGHGLFSVIARGDDPAWGHVFTDHLTVPADVAGDFVAEAERFLGVPYLWGGRSSLGLDCSGLVQVALERSGRPAPRDADMQEAALGTALMTDPVAWDGLAGLGLRRGDLVFWAGHVGIMVDAAHMIHANATHMAVSIDDVAAFAARVQKAAGPVTSVRRLD